MVAFGEQTYTLLSEEARARGITIQELLRAVVIPDWFKAKYEPVPRQAQILASLNQTLLFDSIKSASGPKHHRELSLGQPDCDKEVLPKVPF